MTRLRTTLLCALVLVPALAFAGPGRGGGDDLGAGRPRMPAFLRYLFRPELVMRNQEAIGLTQDQRDAISAAMTSAQQKLLALRWQIEAKGEAATPLFTGDRIDPGPALAAAEEMMSLEEQVKREHLSLLITVKNVLTPEQQKKLREIEPDGWDRRRQ
jgi:Spy/CpxP family protein refolding chaperone